MKTAMQHNNGVEISKKVLWKMLLEAKEKEKQQIIEAATHGANFDKSPYSSAHEYYEKTYNNNEII